MAALFPLMTQAIPKSVALRRNPARAQVRLERRNPGYGYGILSSSEMPGADKFQNGPVRFVVEPTRDGQEILPKDSVSANCNHK